MKPLAFDLFCGLGGWADGFLAEGYECIGFDIERHNYGSGGYPGQLVLQDVLTLHGAQFREAALIVASPPCQAYSARAMPWNRLADSITLGLCQWGDDGGPVDGWAPLPPMDNRLFPACFRIQREASAAAGRYVPLVVENVKGAQRWVGRAAWSYGSFYLWGDVPALMPFTRSVKTVGHASIRDGHSHTRHLTNQAGSDLVGAGVKQHGSGAAWSDKALDERRKAASGIKAGGNWFGTYAEQKAAGTISPGRLHGNRSTARKAASAQIAKIPFELARWIARVYKV